MFFDLDFAEAVVNGEVNYEKGGVHCIPQYVQSLGFLIEYADSYEEAEKHWHEDGDGFPLEMGEKAILAGLENEIRRSFSKS